MTVVPVIDIRDLTLDFIDPDGGTVRVLHGVDLSIAAGETLALVGESGSGKSATSLSIMGLHDRRTSVLGGTVTLRSGDAAPIELLGLTPRAMTAIRGAQIAMIFQDPMTSLNPVQRVGSQIAESLRLHRGLRGSALRTAVHDALREVGIPDPVQRASAYPHELSGGMSQRVLIALALACNPRLLIADEPTTALDVTVQAQILDLLRTVQRARGTAILFITHSLAVVAEIADRVAVMYGGRIVETAPAAELFARPRHPYTRALLDSLPAVHAEPRQRLRVIPGEIIDIRQPPPGLRVRAPLFAVGRRLPDDDAVVRGDRRASRGALPSLAAAMTALLDVAGLTVEFRIPTRPFGSPQTLHAVQDASLTLDRGEVLGVVGESGSGKTTLGRAILRLVPISAGEVRFDGERIDTLPAGRMRPVRHRLQAVFQDPTASLNPAMTIGATIGEGLAVHGIGTRSDRRERVGAMLDRVGLPRSAADRHPRMLSGGQRQRVGIARALIVEPHLLIADEAVSALDVSVQAGIVNLLMHLQAEMALAMMFIAHDLDLVRHFCDRVLVLYLGRVMETGRTADVFARPRHPYTRALLDAVPRIRPSAASPRRILSGDPPSPLAPPSGCVFRTRCPHAVARCGEVVPPLAGANGHAAACIRQHEL